MTGPTEPTIEDLAADRDLWKSRYAAVHEIVLELEHFLDLAIISRGERTITVRARALDALQDSFNAWRQLVEGNIPTDWRVAGEDCGPQPFALDDGDVPF
jgi:hypothetical protein